MRERQKKREEGRMDRELDREKERKAGKSLDREREQGGKRIQKDIERVGVSKRDEGWKSVS